MDKTVKNQRPWQCWQRVLVVGLGATGLSCARFLAHEGLDVAVTDTRAEPPGLVPAQRELRDVALFLGGFAPTAFQAAQAIVVSPGVAVSEPLIAEASARGVPVIGDVDLFAAAAQAPVIAITGSNGKSTVTSLLGAMAREAGRKTAVGGNLGTPLLELIPQEPELYVVELSSFQLETTHSLNAAAAVVLNISEDHMDRYRDLDQYSAAKARIYDGDGVMVLNVDDARVAALARPGRRRRWFGLSAPRDGGLGLERDAAGQWLVSGRNRLLRVADLRLPGRHNVANVLAALALGEAVGLSRRAMITAARQFSGLEHRCQWVAESNGVIWYDDSKATNVGATVAALEGFDRPVVLIAGGDAKGADLSALRAPVARHARAVVLIGRDAGRLADVLDKSVPVERVSDMRAAVAHAAALASPGDVVLLSPACASLDMFRNFAERGRAFADAVRELSV